MSEETNKSERAVQKVGYCCPPLHTRFKKGQSGNPRGGGAGRRRPRALDIQEALWAELNRKVTITENGKRKRVTLLEVGLKRMATAGAGQDVRQQRLFLDLLRVFATLKGPAEAEAPQALGEDDAAIALDLLKRLRGSEEGGET